MIAQMAYDLGEWAMVNLGFGDVIAKLEEYWGKGLTKAFVTLIGVCIALWVVGTAATASVYPLINWLTAVLSGNEQAEGLRGTINWVLTAVWVCLVGWFFIAIYKARHSLMLFAKNKDRIDRAITNVDKLEAEIAENLAESQRLLDLAAAQAARADAALEKALSATEENGRSTVQAKEKPTS